MQAFDRYFDEGGAILLLVIGAMGALVIVTHPIVASLFM